MAAYRRVYDSRHLQADCKEPGSAPEPYTLIRVWATLPLLPNESLLSCLFLAIVWKHDVIHKTEST